MFTLQILHTNSSINYPPPPPPLLLISKLVVAKVSFLGQGFGFCCCNSGFLISRFALLSHHQHLNNVGSVTGYTFLETGTCLCLCSYNGSNYDPITTFISCIYLSINYATYVSLNIYVHVFLLYVLKQLQTSLGIKIILHLASRKPIKHLITERSMFRN